MILGRLGLKIKLAGIFLMKMTFLCKLWTHKTEQSLVFKPHTHSAQFIKQWTWPNTIIQRLSKPLILRIGLSDFVVKKPLFSTMQSNIFGKLELKCIFCLM